MSFDFDAWRANYDAMTYQDHQRIYSQLWNLYPVQQHFDGAACEQFLVHETCGHVLEVGGWNGELAAWIMSRNPSAYIASWTNIEICREAADASVAIDGPYNWIVPGVPVWDLQIKGLFDTLVMSHSAEHMRWSELQATVRNLPYLRAIYLASPLPEDGSAPDWNHYPGTHILEVGWDVIDADLQARGFQMMDSPRTHEVRCWAK